MRRSPIARAALSAAVVAVAVVIGSACRTWRPANASLPASRAIAEAPGGVIRFSSRSFDRVELRGARVEGDSLVGYLRPHAGAPDENLRVTVALRDVLTVEERRLSAGRTGLAVAGGVAGVLAVLAGLIASSGGIGLGG